MGVYTPNTLHLLHDTFHCSTWNLFSDRSGQNALVSCTAITHSVLIKRPYLLGDLTSGPVQMLNCRPYMDAVAHYCLCLLREGHLKAKYFIQLLTSSIHKNRRKVCVRLIGSANVDGISQPMGENQKIYCPLQLTGN